MNILIGSFEERLRKSISFAWGIFSEKVGSGLILINKEASMQLQYSYILQQVIPLICFSDQESARIELETGVKVEGKYREIDLVLIGSNGGNDYNVAVEMKCYREYAASGGKRGATDIFMKDVYEDLHLLESYCKHAGFHKGVALVMNDLERLVNPKKKEAKCWDYDISNSTKVSNRHLTTPIGGKSVDLKVAKSYEFKWVKNGSFWFLENEGV
ncbi:MAG: hypothetical protein KAT48_14555 [Bacteroidales bacterium]|nr:hypothetical protein [Bacteroidales bacterium]